MEKKRCTAVVLAAGTGSRMKSNVAKQFMLLKGHPLVYYSLKAVEASSIIDDCILVTGESDVAYVQREIVEKYGFHKVVAVIPGGKERYHSVNNALEVIRQGGLRIPNQDGFVFIHDGARPLLTEQILRDTYEAVSTCHACVTATPSKDTVKLVDEQGYAMGTPERRRVWNVQTPQVFDTSLITDAYARLMRSLSELEQAGVPVTDDAGVVELFTDTRVRLVSGSYENIKITTPEDIPVAEVFLDKMHEMSKET
ncbi:MAG: 2-C-methyl-D-erythritol 4-phosphate cytidylyltransferase [Lachnospiraceae bacterium]|nr:2-C-methyl-D-erythritol 4-phosphate cytidylyltransferase [Lachnospiraceae bacterium]